MNDYQPPAEDDGLPYDPADLLPFEKELEPRDPNVERLPKQFQGTGQVLYGGDTVG